MNDLWCYNIEKDNWKDLTEESIGAPSPRYKFATTV